MRDEAIVIVGAGPTGLALAAELHRLGTPALLLDKLPAGQNTSRATIVHARTLEVLERLGISQQLIDRGLVLHTARMFERDRQMASVSFDGLDTKYSYMLVCTQDQTEQVLEGRLKELGGAVTRPVEVVRVAREAEGSALTVKKEDGSTEEIHAKWLVGCDGMHSMVREAAGIGFEGGNYEENFVLADVAMEYPFGREQMDMFLTDEGLVLVVPLPHGFRVIATVPEAPHAPSLEDMQHIMDTRGPESRKAVMKQLIWSSRFRIQHRVATALYRDGMFICGDAAHVHSPAGGQGMNTGIQDAVSLAAVLHAGSGFEEWEAKRLKIARNVVRTTDLMTKIAATDSKPVHLLRDLAFTVMGHFPAMQHAMAEQLSEIDNK